MSTCRHKGHFQPSVRCLTLFHRINTSVTQTGVILHKLGHAPSPLSPHLSWSSGRCDAAPDPSIAVTSPPRKDKRSPKLASVRFAYSCALLASGAALIGGEQRSSGVRLISLLRPNGRSSHQCSLESLISRVSQRASAHAGAPAPVSATFLQGRTFSPTNHP